MKIHTTNYFNTFILIADDCPISVSEPPPVKENKRTVANMQFDLIRKNPYQFSSDDLLFRIFAERNELTRQEYDREREKFFSKGQACLRASPLSKRYGWGIHYDEKGKIAIYGCETAAYKKFSTSKSLTLLKAMKSAK